MNDLPKPLTRLILMLLCFSLAIPALAEDAEKVLSMTVTSCSDAQTGMTVGRCMAPTDFQVESATEWGGVWQSAGAPARVSVNATSPDSRVLLSYSSGASYIHYVSRTLGGAPYAEHVDGQFDTQTMTPMLTFMYAEGYADFMIASLFPNAEITIESQAEVSADEQSLMEQHASELYSSAVQLFAGQSSTTIDGGYFGMTERTYSLDNAGEKYLAVVITGTEALQMTMRADMGSVGEAVSTITTWNSPCFYLFLVPQAEYDAYRPAFDLFTQNTTVSDEFTNACEALSSQIYSHMTERNIESMETVREYCQGQLSQAVKSAGTAEYDTASKWTDYIYERNDYTLASGEHVKVSVAYDYVYADGSTVYATSSALDVPAGAELLTPN